MSIEAIIYARLAATAGVTALVSTRITPEARSQGAILPAIIYSVSSDEAMQTLGAMVGVKAEIEVVSIATTKKSALEIAEAVKASLERYVVTNTSIRVFQVLLLRTVGQYVAPAAGESVGVFTQAGMYSVMYENL